MLLKERLWRGKALRVLYNLGKKCTQISQTREDAKQTTGTEQAATIPFLLCHHTGLSHQFLFQSLVYVTSADINGFPFQTYAKACLV